MLGLEAEPVVELLLHAELEGQLPGLHPLQLVNSFSRPFDLGHGDAALKDPADEHADGRGLLARQEAAVVLEQVEEQELVPSRRLWIREDV